MHASMLRLLNLAREATAAHEAPVKDFADLGRKLGQSSAVMTNWKKRGVSKEGAIAAAALFDGSADHILNGDTEISKPGKPLSKTTVVAHGLSHQPFDHLPLTREQIMRMEGGLPERFTHVLEDDAMGGFGRAGTEVLFHRTGAAKLGAGVLVRDKAGQVYVRRKAQGLSDAHWLAVPVATGGIYRELDSEKDGLTILAVWRGVVNRGIEDL